MPPERDSIGRTFAVALLVCGLCSIAVSAVTVALRPAQQRNQVQEVRRNILAAAGLLEEGKTIDEIYAQRIQARLVELATGDFVEPEPEPSAVGSVPGAAEPMVEIPPAKDLARIRRRAERQTVYLVEAQDSLEAIILPIRGLGLWSVLHGFISLDADMNTILGLGFHEHGETPGLGGEVDNPRWKAQWRGKRAFGPDGSPAIEVIKGSVERDSPQALYQVDGLSGATITTRGVTNLLRYWLGEHGYGPLLARLSRQTEVEAEAAEPKGAELDEVGLDEAGRDDGGSDD